MAPIAPLVAGHWPRRLGGLPGPFSAPAGSGESPTAAPLQVELFIDGMWIDITSYVMVRDGSQQITMSAGQPNEGTRMDPGACTLQLNNRDGRFSPRNPASPYYGKLGRNQPIRVSVPSGNAKCYRHWGEVTAWPQRWDTTGTDVWVDLQAAGILRRLGQGAAPLQSAMRRELSSPSRTHIFAYWPMEDGTEATAFASAISGASPLAVTGAVSPGRYSDWAASAPLPTMGTGYAIGPVPSYTLTGTWASRLFVHLPSGGVSTNQRVLALAGTGSAAAWSILVDSTGRIAVRAYDKSAIQLLDSGWQSWNLNDRQATIGLDLVETGGNVAWNLYGFDIGLSTLNIASAIGTASGTLSSQTIGRCTAVATGPDGGLGETAVGHISIADDIAAYANTGSAMVAWAGETAQARIVRLCQDQAVSLATIGDASDTAVMGPQAVDTLLSLLEASAEADGGMLTEQVDGVGLVYRNRVSLYNQDAALALDYTAANLAEVPEPVDDDEYVRNDVTVHRSSGSWSRQTLDNGPLSTLPPPAGVGRYASDVTLNLNADADLVQQASWRLHLGTVDEPRYPRITINLAHPSFTGALRQQALAVRKGDRLTIENPPSWLPPDDISQLVLGVSETLDQFQHRITYTCAPESPYRVMVLSDTVLSRLDGDSTLSAPAGAASTSLSVATAAGGSLWTTTDTPVDIEVGGERMTVTAVAGASSPQTFTVTRSVNGITKAQTAGTAVNLYQPAYLAL